MLSKKIYTFEILTTTLSTKATITNMDFQYLKNVLLLLDCSANIFHLCSKRYSMKNGLMVLSWYNTNSTL